ncbi:MAG: NAD(P)H-binding protein, partial [Phycisphaerales bacterium]
MRYLIAGATGYLGGHLVLEMRRRGLDVIAIARNSEKLKAAGLDAQRCVVAQVTDPESIHGVCDGIDVVLSTVGITRQKAGLTYMDVDYQA